MVREFAQFEWYRGYCLFKTRLKENLGRVFFYSQEGEIIMNPSKTMLQLSEIAARIKEMRDIMGWSIEELSEKTEFSIDECIAYEGGN